MSSQKIIEDFAFQVKQKTKKITVIKIRLLLIYTEKNGLLRQQN